MVKNPPASAGDADSVPGLGRSPGEGNGNPVKIPWAEEPDVLQSMGSHRVDMTEQINTHMPS